MRHNAGSQNQPSPPFPNRIDPIYFQTFDLALGYATAYVPLVLEAGPFIKEFPGTSFGFPQLRGARNGGVLPRRQGDDRLKPPLGKGTSQIATTAGFGLSLLKY